MKFASRWDLEVPSQDVERTLNELGVLRDAVWMDGNPFRDVYSACVFCFAPSRHDDDCVWLAEDRRRSSV